MKLFTVSLVPSSSRHLVHRHAVRLVIEQEGRYLMVCSRYGDAKFPGGGQNANESDLETAYRELLEETGYMLDTCSLVPIGEVDEFRPGMEKDTTLAMISSYYHATIKPNPPQRQHLEGYEIDYRYEVKWLSLTDAYQMNEKAYRLYKDQVPWCVREMRLIDYLRMRKEI